MGSTLPCRVISPVMATSPRTGTPDRQDTRAVVRVTPAEGPSLGTAPSGAWMCRSHFFSRSGSMPYSSAWTRTQVTASCALSFITSPREPVTVILPVPLSMTCTSMGRVSPPTLVHARPLAMPTALVRLRKSGLTMRGPSSSSSMVAVTATLSTSPAAILRAHLRSTLVMVRSRLRTPASRV